MLALLQPFVMSLDTVEHVHFERVTFASKNFDMVFIMKNGQRAPIGKKPFVRVSMIPMASLEDIKSWLTDLVEVVRSQKSAIRGVAVAFRSPFCCVAVTSDIHTNRNEPELGKTDP